MPPSSFIFSMLLAYFSIRSAQFIERGWTIDKIVSHIVQDDHEEYALDTTGLIKAFEDHYGRKIRIYRKEAAVQLKIFQ